MKSFIISIGLVFFIFISYAFIGTGHHVDEIKEKAPAEISKRGWEIMRYEGFEYGSFRTNGGKVWYHVRNSDNNNIQYRVFISMWNGELQFYYKDPEKLERSEININAKHGL